MRCNQDSSSAAVRVLIVGSEPTTPLSQAAITRSGPETRNIGAAITGKRNRAFNSAIANEINFPQKVSEPCNQVRR